MGFYFSHFPGKNFENPMGKISFFEKSFSVKLGLNTLICFMSSSGSSDQDSTTISQISFREGRSLL